MSSNNDGGEFFKGFLFGGLVGAVVSLLYAPKSGKEMREDLRTASQEIMEDAGSRLEVTQEKADALMEQTRKQLDELRREAEAAIAELKNSALGKVEEGKSAVDKEKGRIKEALDAGVAAYQKEKKGRSNKTS